MLPIDFCRSITIINDYCTREMEISINYYIDLGYIWTFYVDLDLHVIIVYIIGFYSKLTLGSFILSFELSKYLFDYFIFIFELSILHLKKLYWINSHNFEFWLHIVGLWWEKDFVVVYVLNLVILFLLWFKEQYQKSVHILLCLGIFYILLLLVLKNDGGKRTECNQ